MRKDLAFTICTVMGLALTACGPLASSQSAAPTGESQEMSAQASADGATEVTLWHYFEHETEYLNEIIKEYNASQNEIRIVPTFVSRDELMKQYTIGAVSGELPDIGMVDSPDMASYISLGIFENISLQLEGWSDINEFYEGPLSSCKDKDGNIYGLPMNSNCLAILCNMDILRAAGFENPPTTWEEFEEVCAATTNTTEGVYGFAMSAISNEEGTFQYIPWLYGSGASIESIDSEDSIAGLSFLTNLINKGYMSKEVVNWGQGDAYKAFIAGKAAMLESGTWQIATLDGQDKDKINFEYMYVPMPKRGESQATCIGGENFGICTGSKKVDACVDFLKYLMSAQSNADWCEVAGKLPIRADAVPLKDFWTADARYKVFNDSMAFAVPRGPHESWPVISEAIYKAEQSALLGKKTPEEALKEAAAVINPLLQ